MLGLVCVWLAGTRAQAQESPVMTISYTPPVPAGPAFVNDFYKPAVSDDASAALTITKDSQNVYFLEFTENSEHALVCTGTVTETIEFVVSFPITKTPGIGIMSLSLPALAASIDSDETRTFTTAVNKFRDRKSYLNTISTGPGSQTFMAYTVIDDDDVPVYGTLWAKSVLAIKSSQWLCPSFFSRFITDVLPDSPEEVNAYTPGSLYNNYPTFLPSLALIGCSEGYARESLNSSYTIFGKVSVNLVETLKWLGLENQTYPRTAIAPKYPCLEWKKVLNDNNKEKAYSYLRNWLSFTSGLSDVPDAAGIDSFFTQSRLLGNVCANFKDDSGNPLFGYASCPVAWDASTDFALLQPGENLYLYSTSENQPLNEQEYFMLIPCEISQEFTQTAVDTAFNLAACIPCPKGSASCPPCTGSGSCTPTTQQCGRVCTPCQPGKYTDTEGIALCDVCGEGTYSDEVGATQCKQCTDGSTTSEEGATVCHDEDCPVGTFYNTQTSVCDNCGAGTYQDETRQTECKSCLGPGRVLESPSVCKCDNGYGTATGSPETCLACEIGTYQDEETLGLCKACAEKESTATTGANDQAECKCIRGYGYDTADSACEICQPGTYNDELEETPCKKCIAGQFNDEQGSTVPCLACEQGTYSGTDASSECTACEKGKYNSVGGVLSTDTGATECKNCVVGTYASKTGESACNPCRPGYNAGQERSFFCTRCLTGTFADTSGESQCKQCSQGTYQAQTGQTSCTLCSLGTSSSVPSRRTSCDKCAGGKFQNEQGQTTCLPCLGGTYIEENGQSACKQCEAGTYGPVNELLGCYAAPVARFIPSAGAIGYSREVNSCPPGKSAPYMGLSECIPCGAGTFRDTKFDDNPDGCTACEVGTFQNERGSSLCSACPSDQTAPTEGLAYCLCNPGKFTVAPGVCQRCGGQKYQNLMDMPSCKTCGEFLMPLPDHTGCVSVIEEVTRTCLMVFWVPECYKNGVHPITVAIWLFIVILAWYTGRYVTKKTWNFIWS